MPRGAQGRAAQPHPSALQLLNKQPRASGLPTNAAPGCDLPGHEGSISLHQHTSKQNPQGRINSLTNTESSSNNVTNGSQRVPTGGAPFKPGILVGGAQDNEPGEIPDSTAPAG